MLEVVNYDLLIIQKVITFRSGVLYSESQTNVKKCITQGGCTMTKTRKRLTALALSLCTLTGNVLGLTASASYDSSPFTNFTASANISGVYNALSPPQHKETNSSVFIHLSSATNGAWVQVWGLNGPSWSSGGQNCTYSYATGNITSHYVLSLGDNYVPNLVNEYGYNYCGLKFCSASYYYNSTISGYWAPDC